MFVVEDEAKIAEELIPQSFDHNKVASFLRQINCHGFRKVQPNDLRKADFNESKTNHRTFMNGSLKRDAKELICKFKRLKEQERRVAYLEGKVMSLTGKMEVLEDTNSLLEKKLLTLEQHVQNMEDKDELDQSSMNKSRASTPSSAIMEQQSHSTIERNCNSLQTHNIALPISSQDSRTPLPQCPSSASLNVAEVFSRESEPSYVHISEFSSEPLSVPTLPKNTDAKLSVRQGMVDVQKQKRMVETHSCTQNESPHGNRPLLSTVTNEMGESLDLDASFSPSRASSPINTQTWDII